jgi:hypothetical protein
MVDIFQDRSNFPLNREFPNPRSFNYCLQGLEKAVLNTVMVKSKNRF